MSTAQTTITPGAGIQLPYIQQQPLIEVRKVWSDDWQPIDLLELVRCTRAVAGQDIGVAELRQRYGRMVWPGTTEFDITAPGDVDQWWVRISLPQRDDAGQVIYDAGQVAYDRFFIGRFDNENRQTFDKPTDDDGAPIDTGLQTWIAWDAARALHKLPLSESFWYTGTGTSGTASAISAATSKVGWMPDFNLRQKEAKVVLGNAYHITNTSKDGQIVTLFGGTEMWTRLEALQYLLDYYLNCDGGPVWTVNDSTGLLTQMQDVICLKDIQTLADGIRLVVPLKRGLDWTVRYTDAGFEIYVFSINPQPVTFNGQTLPANPDTVDFSTIESPAASMPPRITRSHDQQYDRIRLLGNRILVCCTLAGANAVGVDDSIKGTLQPRWSSTLEAEYRSPPGAANPLQADIARKAEKYRPVFRYLGILPNWDHQGGRAAPLLDDNGQVVPFVAASGDTPAQGVADYQSARIQPVSHLPILEGYQYVDSSGNWLDTPVNINAVDNEPALVPVAAWIWHEVLGRYYPAEEMGISVHVHPFSLAITLGASPNHLVAKNHWTLGTDLSLVPPKFDFSKMIVTLSFLADQRAQLVQTIDNPNYDNGPLTTLDVPATDESSDLEFWYVTPRTILGINPDGSFISSGADPHWTRNDMPNMGYLMCGALARYYLTRCKAEVRVKGLWAWHSLLGQIWNASGWGADRTDVLAPFTHIEWICTEGQDNEPGEQLTIVRGGFAR